MRKSFSIWKGIIVLITILILLFCSLNVINKNTKIANKDRRKMNALSNTRGTIINVPIDSRPISNSNFQYLVETSGYNYVGMNPSYLDKMDVNEKYYKGNDTQIRKELLDTLENGNYNNSNTTIIINTSTYFFGGLIGTRDYNSYNNMSEKMNQLEYVVSNYNNPNYYVIMHIPRILPDSRAVVFPKVNGIQFTNYTKVRGLQEYKDRSNVKGTTFENAVIEWVYFKYWEKMDGNSLEELPQYVQNFYEDFYNTYNIENFLDNYNSTFEQAYTYMEGLINLNLTLKNDGKNQFKLIFSVDDFNASPFFVNNVNNAGTSEYMFIEKDTNGNLKKIGPWYYYYETILKGYENDEKCIIIPGTDEIHHIILARDLVEKTGNGIQFNYLNAIDNTNNFGNDLGYIGTYDQANVLDNFNIRDDFINQNASKTIEVDTYLTRYYRQNKGSRDLDDEEANIAAQNIISNKNNKAVIGVDDFDGKLLAQLVNKGNIFDLTYCSAWNTIGNSAGVGLASIVAGAILEKEASEKEIDEARIKKYIEYKIITVLEGAVYNSHKYPPDGMSYQQENNANIDGRILAERISYVGGQGRNSGQSLIDELLYNNKNEKFVYVIGNKKYTVDTADISAIRPWYRAFEVKITPNISITNIGIADVFIGDSKFVEMHNIIRDNDVWMVKRDAELNWVQQNAIPSLEKNFMIGKDTNIIIQIGFNDLFDSNNMTDNVVNVNKVVQEYKTYFDNKALEWKQKGVKEIYFCLQPPVDESKINNEEFVNNYNLKAFNNEIKTNLVGYKFIDLYSPIDPAENNFSSDFYREDGIHGVAKFYAMEYTNIKIAMEQNYKPTYSITTTPYELNTEEDKAIKWAYKNVYIDPIYEESFEPDTTCTRADIITLMWRMQGIPLYLGTDYPISFTDVFTDDLYSDAVYWAKYNKWTNGKNSSITFCPNDTCTIRELLSFIYNMKTEPDNRDNSIYSNILNWAKNDIGIIEDSDGLNAEDECTRINAIKILYRDFIKNYPHEWEDGEIIIQATCTTAGEKIIMCSKCGETQRVSIAALGHEELVDERIEPTCTETGLTEGKHCSRCNAVLTEQHVIPANGHSYGEWIVTIQPTCTEVGEETGTCSKCGKTETRAIQALEHNYTEEITAPTCEEQGYTTHRCTRCDDSYIDTYIEALGHDYESKVTTEPTCTEAGEETRTCSECEETETRVIQALGHNYIEEVTAPTCEEQGYTTHTCTRCDDSYVDNYVEALGHDYEVQVTTEPTCTQKGVRTYICKNDSSHTYTEEIDALGHNYENGVCTRCGEEESQITIETETYSMEGNYIIDIQPGTTVSSLIKGITTNAETKEVYKGEEKISNTDKIGTGMILKLRLGEEEITLEIVVTGDINGDGEADFRDIVTMNKHRLEKTRLEGAYHKAGDVTGDGEVDFKDIVKVNKYRLNKIHIL